jgi:uncharacterized protein YggE
MKNNSVKITLIISVAVVLIAAITLSSLTSSSETIESSGQASVSVTPDYTTIYLSVQSSGATQVIAKDLNSKTVEEVKSAIMTLGFTEDQITTENFNIYEEFDWSKEERTSLGYKATHTLKIKTDTSDDNAGEVIDAGVDAGATLNYINYELTTENQNKAKAEALKLATEDARGKAQAIASGLGAKLGSVVSVTASNYDYPMMRTYAMEDSASSGSVSTDIEVANKEVSASVSVIYKIK